MATIRNLSVQYEGSDESVPTRPPDISPRGMFINTSQQFPEGAVLTVKFGLGLSGEEIEARTEVRYCSPGIGVGVEFTDISPESAAAIQREIDLSAIRTAAASKGRELKSRRKRAQIRASKAG